jgi:hypothetical protein
VDYLNGKSKTIKVNKVYEPLVKAFLFISEETDTAYVTEDLTEAVYDASEYFGLGMLVYDRFFYDLDKSGVDYKSIIDIVDEDTDKSLDGVDKEESVKA